MSATRTNFLRFCCLVSGVLVSSACRFGAAFLRPRVLTGVLEGLFFRNESLEADLPNVLSFSVSWCTPVSSVLSRAMLTFGLDSWSNPWAVSCPFTVEDMHRPFFFYKIKNSKCINTNAMCSFLIVFSLSLGKCLSGCDKIRYLATAYTTIFEVKALHFYFTFSPHLSQSAYSSCLPSSFLIRELAYLYLYCTHSIPQLWQSLSCFLVCGYLVKHCQCQRWKQTTYILVIQTLWYDRRKMNDICFSFVPNNTRS